MNSKIYICGDLHGDYYPVETFYEYMNFIDRPLTENNVLIVLGDFGANYYLGLRDNIFKEHLNDYKMTYFIIRGNHEERPSICMRKNPSQWHIEDFWNGQVYVENDYPYIKYALDIPSKYEIPTAHGKPIKTLVLPGAYSVDKNYRLAKHWSWFPQEQCNEEEMLWGKMLAATADWDLILSHTCPVVCEPTDLFLPIIDQSKVDKTTEIWLGDIEYKTNYKLWCWGHYHANRVYPRVENKDKLMLFNDCFLDVYKYFCGNYDLYNSLIKTRIDI
jgi:3-oxoacid CoA-transferase subunit A